MTVMARNGTEFGIRVSGLGDRWFTGPSGTPVGLYFAGFSGEDANPDMGDSAITETAGLGAFAMAGAPAIVQFVGGTPADALGHTRRMYEITLGESEAYRLPALDFRGTPTGIDIRLVLQTGILPQINTGIAHRLPGIGQIGAGLVNPPLVCFEAAGRALAAELAGTRSRSAKAQARERAARFAVRVRGPNCADAARARRWLSSLAVAGDDRPRCGRGARRSSRSRATSSRTSTRSSPSSSGRAPTARPGS